MSYENAKGLFTRALSIYALDEVIYKKVSPYLLNKNLELIKDFRLINGGF